MSFGTLFSHFTLALSSVAWYAIIILAVILLVYLLRIARWYIKKNDIPHLFGRRNKKDTEE